MQLSHAYVVACIVAQQFQSLAANALAAMLGSDEEAQLGTVVERVEVEEVNRTHGSAVGSAHNHQSQCAVGVYVGSAVFEILPQHLARVGCNGIGNGPQCGVVFPRVQCVEVGGLQCSQGDELVVHGGYILGEMTMPWRRASM